MRFVVSTLVLTGLLLAPNSADANVTNPNVQPPRHLYVSADKTIFRYELNNGIPSDKPDLTISGFGSLAGVSPDGTVYSGKGVAVFFAFKPGSKKPDRRFRIPIVYGCSGNMSVTGSAVDPEGNFWVTIAPFSEGRMHLAHPTSSLPCIAAMAFSPQARGDVSPMQVFPIDGYYGMTINSHGDLFSDATNESGPYVEEYTDILRHPHLLSVYQNSYTNEYGTATASDSAGDLFVRATLPNHDGGIAVWAPGADPAGPPTSVVDASGSDIYTIAADDRYVYAVDSRAGTIGVYKAHQNGPQQPVKSIQIPSLFLGKILVGH